MDDLLYRGGRDVCPLRLAEGLDDVVLAHASPVEAHDPVLEVAEVVAVLLQELRLEGEEPRPRDLYREVTEGGADLALVVAVPRGVLPLGRGLVEHREELLRDRALDEELVGPAEPVGEVPREVLRGRLHRRREEALLDDPLGYVRGVPHDSLQFLVAKLTKLFYTLHGAVAFLCF